MSDRYHAHLKVGGPVSKCLIPALGAHLADTGLLSPGDDLKQHIDEDGLLVLEDDQAPYGEFPELETWLEEHDIAFDRHSVGYFDLLPEWVSHRKGQGRIVHLLDAGGDEVISHQDIEQALANATSLLTLQVSLSRLLGPEVPPLKPINLNPKEQRTP